MLVSDDDEYLSKYKWSQVHRDSFRANLIGQLPLLNQVTSIIERSENYLVLPGQVLQPDAKGGGNPYRKHKELKSAVLGHTALSNRPQYHAQTGPFESFYLRL